MINISMYMNDVPIARQTGAVIVNYLKKANCEAALRIKSNINSMVELIDEDITDIYIIDFTNLEVGIEFCRLIRTKSMIPAILVVNADPKTLNRRIFFRPSAILENVTEYKEFLIVLNALRLEKRLENRYFTFKCEGEMVRVPYKSVEYFESNAKIVTVKIAKSTTTYNFTSKLSDIEGTLPEYFLRCHQSYIVNMNHILKTDSVNRSFYMTSNEEILISRRMYTEAIEKYRAYIESNALQ